MLRVTGFGQYGPYATPACVRHARRGDDRLRAPDRPAGRPADAAAVRAGRRRRRPGRGDRGDDSRCYHRDRNGGRGQVIDLSLFEPLLTILGPGPSVYDQLGVVPGAARQPLAQQRPAQHLPDPRRPLGRRLHQRHLGRRAGAAARRAPRHRRAAVVPIRAESGSTTSTSSTASWAPGSRARFRRRHRGLRPGRRGDRPRLRRRAADGRPAGEGARRDHHGRGRGPRAAADAERDVPPVAAPRDRSASPGGGSARTTSRSTASGSAWIRSRIAELRADGAI